MNAGFNRRQLLEGAGSYLMARGVAAQRSAAARQSMPDVVVVLPGIMGSVLQKDGKVVWAVSGSAILRVLRDASGTASTLTVRGDSEEADDLGDGIVPTRLIADTQILPGFWKVDGYTGLSAALKSAFDLREGENYFEFAYDWRRDNRAAARRLARLSSDWLKTWRQRSGNKNAKLLILAHSMGGLVARYFVECLEGWRSTRRLITFGTPFRGSLNALDILSNGLSTGGVEIESFSRMARSFTSIYQLLPRYPCYDAGGGLVRIGETKGIPNMNSELAGGALAFHHEIDACAERNRKGSDYLASLRIHPIVGTYQKTLQSARLVNGRVQMLSTHPSAPLDGDGTVPQVSAIPIEESGDDAVYVSQKHASLQNTPAILDHIMKLLATKDLSNIRAAPDIQAVQLSLEVGDVHSTAEHISVLVTSSGEVEVLSTVVEAADTHAVVQRVEMRRSENNSFSMELSPLTEGVYRIRVESKPGGASVADVFAVFDVR